MPKLSNSTVGASGILMTCISDIKRLSHQLKHDTFLSIPSIARDLFSRLEQCRDLAMQDLCHFADIEHTSSLSSSRHKMMAFYHLSAFIAATYIYLYQTLFSLPPSRLSSYVNDVFFNVQAFYALDDDNNCCLWPAFIAAAAAYEEKDLEAAKAWLDRTDHVATGDRIQVRDLVEEVWRVRAAAARSTGRHPGNVNVDLMQVMVKLDLDTEHNTPGPRFSPVHRNKALRLQDEYARSCY